MFISPDVLQQSDSENEFQNSLPYCDIIPMEGIEISIDEKIIRSRQTCAQSKPEI